MGVAAVAQIGIAAYGAYSARKAARQQLAHAKQQSAEALAWQKEQQAKLDAQKEVYTNFTFENPYANMENVYEDLTISQKAVEFGRQQIQQQQANLLGGLRDIAGASGVAALAQTLANQGAIQAQRISSVVAQEEVGLKGMRAQGAAAIQLAERQGEEAIQKAEMSRQATLLGVSYQEAAGANLAVQQANQNQMQAHLYGTAQQQAAWQNLAGLPWQELIPGT